MKKLAAVSALIAISGCATAVTRYSVTAEDEPYSYFENGVPFIISEGENSRVTIGPAAVAQDADGRQLFFIEVVNLGDTRFNIGPENIVVTTDTDEAVAVLTPEKLQREANREANWLAFSSSLQQMSNSLAASNAGYSHSSANYSAQTNYYGSRAYGSATTYGHASYSNYSGSAAAQAHFAAQAENRAIRAEYTARISELLRTAQDGAIQRQTVRPRGNISSLVLLEKIPDKAKTIRVEANIAGESHSMSWNYWVE
ncbi:MAG TPA: hypothetical protein DEA50_06320 [Parvularcula sp.]|nr:hypothetical protein [Parvularcula sp.]